MADKGGLGAIPILPQNMLATKEENPRKFFAQIIYIFFWIALLVLFIVYAAFNLKELIEAQDNPVITLSTQSEEEIKYPVFVVCPFRPLAFTGGDDISYFAYGLYTDEKVFNLGDGWKNPQSTAIDKNNGLTNPKKGQEDNNDKDKDKKKDKTFGNTGSIFPTKRICNGNFAIPSKEEREKLTKEQLEVTTNMFAVSFRSLVDLKQAVEASGKGKGGNDDNDKGNDDDQNKAKIKTTPYYYPCVIFNSDREPTDKDFDRWRNPFSGEGKQDCEKDDKVEKLLDEKDEAAKTKLKKKKKDNISFKQAYARDVGYYDSYIMKIKTYWRYEDNEESSDYGNPDEFTVTTLSVTLADTLDNVKPTAAEYASLAVTVGTRVVLFIRKIEFKCADCDDDEKVVFYNATVNLLDLAFYPEVPYRDENGNLEIEYDEDDIREYQDKYKEAKRLDLWPNELMALTWIQVYYDAMEVTQQEEIYTTTVLDFLGNIAGMAGTLLSFAIINSIDRLLSYIFIQNGAKPSVWDD